MSTENPQLPSWMRTALYATAVMNVLAGIGFMPFAAGVPLKTMIGVPTDGHPLFPATVGLFVFLFGIFYWRQAASGRGERLFIGIGAAGKLAFFSLCVVLALAGSLGPLVPVLASADLVFGGLFLIWLLGADRRPA